MDAPIQLASAAILYFIVAAGLSVVSFAAYWIDKRRAVNGGRRIPERTLHVLALLGGWPGAILGQQQLRHKTQKLSFRLVFWLVVVLHLGVVGATGYVLFGNS